MQKEQDELIKYLKYVNNKYLLIKWTLNLKIFKHDSMYFFLLTVQHQPNFTNAWLRKTTLKINLVPYNGIGLVCEWVLYLFLLQFVQNQLWSLIKCSMKGRPKKRKALKPLANWNYWKQSVWIGSHWICHYKSQEGNEQIKQGELKQCIWFNFAIL